MEKKGNPRRVHAASLGYPVSMSCAYSGEYRNYLLDSSYPGGGLAGNAASGWSSCINDVNQWIKISATHPVEWTGVITQGRAPDFGTYNQWVTSFQVDVSSDGVNWTAVDGGNTFTANTDMNTKVENMFKKPVKGQALRIKPQSWNNHMSMRFDAYHS